MNVKHKEIRSALQSMSPKKAIEYVTSCQLPEDEEVCIIECDIRRKSCVQVANMLYLSVDGVCKLRRKAYRKIADGWE